MSVQWTPIISTSRINTPIINTGRLRLERLHKDHLDRALTVPLIHQMVGWLNDPEVVKYSEQRHVRHTPETQMEYLETILKPDNVEYWLINLSDKERGIIGKLIGSLVLEDKGNGCANIGIMIGDKSAWGHGYALEAMTAVIKHLTGRGFKRFEIGTRLENERMIKLATACGMKAERADGEFVYMAAVI